MRRPRRISRRGRHSESRLVIGSLLVVGGVFILLKLMPPWALWGLVALFCIACGLLLVIG
ncbi:MAG: DUF4175 domain-containing protein [Firmicutes bacterium]|nr:DUF4175 domain-containing protein [Bacillota bacterium]